MVRLSNRQYPMLKQFALGGPAFHMSIGQAQKYDQRPFRSMLVHEWIAFRPGRGFHITKAGKEAWREFEMTEILRKNPLATLTKLFDPAAYPEPQRKLAVVSRRVA